MVTYADGPLQVGRHIGTAPRAGPATADVLHPTLKAGQDNGKHVQLEGWPPCEGVKAPALPPRMLVLYNRIALRLP